MSSLTINAAVVDRLASEHVRTRKLWIDVESAGPEAFLLVLRGEDYHFSGCKQSEAVEPRHRAAQKPALFWNDESAAYRPFVLAHFSDKESADTAAAQILDFYQSEGEDGATFTARWEALGDDARTIMPIMLSVFGCAPTGDQRGKLGSYADYLAGKERKTKKQLEREAKEKAKSEKENAIREEAKRELLAEIAAKVNNRDALSLLLGSANVAPDLQSQLTDVLSKLQALQTAAQ